MPKFERGNRFGRGRVRGSQNERNEEFAQWFRQFAEGNEYRQSLARRILMGRAPHVESYGLALVYGKPLDRVETTGELIIRHELPGE